MKKLFSLLAVVAVSLMVAACDSAPDELATIPKSQPITMEAIASTARGFTVGSPTAAETVYVFFDAQCPHCGYLWEAAKPLRQNVRFGWIPVSFLNKASAAQGATLLGADDPVARMDEHEASLLAHQGGITAAVAPPELKLAMEKNTKLLSSFGAESIPFIVAVDASGKLVSKAGALPTKELAAMLGVQVSVQAAPTQGSPLVGK
jgi:thiol:disulfide interchange protein DsbG